MNIDFVLSALGSIGMGERVLIGGGRSFPLHSMVTSCGWQLRSRGCSYDWHGLKRGKAEFCLIQYTLRGWGMLEFEGRRQKVEAGQTMILHFPHWNRYWLPPESDSWEFLYICLNGRELVRIWRELVGLRGPILELGFDSQQVKMLCEIYAKAIRGELESPFDNSAAAYSMAMSLSKCSVQGSSMQTSRPEAVKRALRLCQEGLSNSELDVDALAVAAGLSRHHFSRIFEKSMGEPPAAYLKDLRLKESTKLLQTSSLSVKEVAGACGFGDCSYFCRVFREAFGVAPGIFRRSGMFGLN